MHTRGRVERTKFVGGEECEKSDVREQMERWRDSVETQDSSATHQRLNVFKRFRTNNRSILPA